MSVQYKFKNTIDHDAVKFDGVLISAADLKQIIIQQKKLGHSELKVENEDTGQTYSDDQMIPKNTNIIVSRLPMANSNKRTRQAAAQPYPARFSGNINSHNNNGPHHSHRSKSASTSSSLSGTPSTSTLGSSDAVSDGREAMELVTTKNQTEEERKKYIQSQSTKDFDPALYARSSRGGGVGGRGGHRGNSRPGSGYLCKKCFIPGHLVYECKANPLHKPVKRCSGIPRTYLTKVDPKEKGALLTSTGEYVVPIMDQEVYRNPKVEKPPCFE